MCRVVTSYPTGSTHLSCLSHTWRPSWGPARSFLGVARETRAVSRECNTTMHERLFLFHMVITRLKTPFVRRNLPLSSLSSTAKEAARRASDQRVVEMNFDRDFGEARGRERAQRSTALVRVAPPATRHRPAYKTALPSDVTHFST